MPQTTAARCRAPLWPRWCVVAGSVLLVAAGGFIVATRVLRAENGGTFVKAHPTRVKSS